MKVSVNRDLCTGHGRCYVLAPEVFAPDENGYCMVIKPEVSAEFEAQALVGVKNCPEDAISVS